MASAAITMMKGEEESTLKYRGKNKLGITGKGTRGTKAVTEEA
jgi:hypothetical protein